LELLEQRLVFASDFGDAPLPYKTLVAEAGAEHVATGPTLGAIRDTEADGVHSAGAQGDDTSMSDDEDGVTFGVIRAGALDATASVNIHGGSAKLDAWIDFNGDGSWGGLGEQIADTVAVATGANVISFDVPSWAKDGTTFARFRLSTGGDLGVGGIAADGEVEDYHVLINPPKGACGCFTSHIISAQAPSTNNVFAADIDGDGDTDALSSSYTENKIAWYENDGSQNFTSHTIDGALYGARIVIAVDMDGDNDLDVLATADYIATDDEIAWYENDGNQNFSHHPISIAANGGFSMAYPADIDSDGDVDLISTDYFNDEIVWHENDGTQSFTAQAIGSADGVRSVYAVDVDGDSDMDVVSGSVFDDKVAWYENDGNQNFTERPISVLADAAHAVFASDVDGDGDTDVLSGSRNDDKIAWYENNGSEVFATHIISTVADSARKVFTADVDGDGDTDVLSASFFDNEITWYENNGLQSFVTRTITNTATGGQSVFVADVDSDHDLDVLSASNGSELAWYENLLQKTGGLTATPVPIAPPPIPAPPGPVGQHLAAPPSGLVRWEAEKFTEQIRHRALAQTAAMAFSESPLIHEHGAIKCFARVDSQNSALDDVLVDTVFS
jgi:hypothetical protein